MSVQAKYYRNQKGTVVHLATCPRISPLHSPPWIWAGDDSGPQLQQRINERGGYAWLRPCSVCKPYEVA